MLLNKFRYLSTLKSQARARGPSDSPPSQPNANFVVDPSTHTNNRPSNSHPLIELQYGIFREQSTSPRISSPTPQVMSPLSEEAPVNTTLDETWNPFSSSLLFLRNKRSSRRAYSSSNAFPFCSQPVKTDMTKPISLPHQLGVSTFA